MVQKTRKEEGWQELALGQDLPREDVCRARSVYKTRPEMAGDVQSTAFARQEDEGWSKGSIYTLEVDYVTRLARGHA